MQIDDTFPPALGAHALGMVGPMPDRDPPAAILDIIEMDIQQFAWPQSALQHQQDHCAVPKPTDCTQQRLDLFS
jgi:hypothetical protein